MTHPIMYLQWFMFKKAVSHLSHLLHNTYKCINIIHINVLMHLMLRASTLDMEYFIISHQHTIAIRTYRLWQTDLINENKTI